MSQPLSPGAGEVLGLGQEGDRPGCHQRDDETVDKGQMVGGQDHRAVPRDVLAALDDRPERQPGQRGQQHPGGGASEHVVLRR